MLSVRRIATLLLTLGVACGVEIGAVENSVDDGKQDGSGSGSGSNPMPPPANLTATAFLAKIGNQYCDESFRCKNTFPLGPTEFANEFGTTVAQCYVGVNAFYAPAAVEQGITAGRISYNSAAAMLCAAGIKYPADCAVFWQTNPTIPVACGAALVGLVPDGSACISDFDCSNANSGCIDATKRCGPEP